MTDEEQEEYQVECTTEEAEAIEKVILNALRKHNNPNAIAVIIGLSNALLTACLLYTSPSPRDRQKSRMPSSA